MGEIRIGEEVVAKRGEASGSRVVIYKLDSRIVSDGYVSVHAVSSK